MAYVKTDWENLPSTDTPITETALDNMENGIEYNDQRLNGTKPMGSIVVDDVSFKNMLPNNNGSRTINGLTFTVNDDKSITVNGTATANTGLPLISDVNVYSNLGLKNGDYTLSGCPANGTANTYSIYMDIKHSDNTNDAYYEIGNGLTFTRQDGDTFYVIVRIGNGTTVSNLTFYPQIEAGSEATTYTPHKNFDNTEYVLYSNNNPTWQETSYTLSDNVMNYEKIKLYFSRYGVSSSSVEIYPALNSYPNCFISYSQSNIVRLYSTTFYLNNNSITISNQYYVNMTGNNTFQMFVETANNLSLYKVVGINKINNLPVTSSVSLLSIQSEEE